MHQICWELNFYASCNIDIKAKTKQKKEAEGETKYKYTSTLAAIAYWGEMWEWF